MQRIFEREKKHGWVLTRGARRVLEFSSLLKGNSPGQRETVHQWGGTKKENRSLKKKNGRKKKKEDETPPMGRRGKVCKGEGRKKDFLKKTQPSPQQTQNRAIQTKRGKKKHVGRTGEGANIQMERHQTKKLPRKRAPTVPWGKKSRSYKKKRKDTVIRPRDPKEGSGSKRT